jgi:cellulose synthase/poly-beta-1,6-N-acetylglucosamine synthase-like glycosyltransferase
VLPQNVGVPGARNIGVEKAASEFIAFLDADAYATAGWLDALVSPFDDESVVCTGGPDQAPENDNPFALAVDYSLRSLIGSGRLRRDNAFAPYAPAGCNMAVRRSDFEALDGFDESLDQRGEEKEFLQRLRRGGGRVVFCEQALIWHHRRVSVRQFWRQNLYSGKARTDILRRAPDAFAWPHMFPAAVVLALLAGLFGWGLGYGVPMLSIPALYLGALLVDGGLAWAKTRSLAIALRVPLTSSMVHIGYGLGLFWGASRWMLGKPVGSGAKGMQLPRTSS